MDSSFRLALNSYELAIEILKYHVVPRRILTQNASADETLNTLNDGLRLRFNKYSTKVSEIFIYSYKINHINNICIIYQFNNVYISNKLGVKEVYFAC